MTKGVKHYFKNGKEHTGATHKDAKGRVMSGARHTASSKFLVHKKDLSETAKKRANAWVVHVFALVLYIGIADDRKLVSDDMLFRKLETCNYYAREIVRRYGYHSNTKDFGVAYCVPRLVDPDKARIYWMAGIGALLNLAKSGRKIGALPDARSAAEAQASKIGALPESSKVEYVSTDVIADNVAQFNLPRYDVGKFGGDFESGDLGENPAILDAFNASGKPTLKESIAQEGIKEPIEIEVALKNGEVSIGQGHHRLQAAIELGMEKVPVVIKTKQNPRTGRAGDGAVKPAIVNLSGISKKSNTDYSFSEFGLLDRIIKPKETAREIQERGGTVYMDFETGDVSDRRFPSTYTPIRNLDKLRE